MGDALLAAAVTAMVLVDLSSASDAIGVRRTDAWAVILSLLQTCRSPSVGVPPW